MKRMLSVTLTIAVILSGCAARGSVRTDGMPAPRAERGEALEDAAQAELWRQFAQRLPAGASIRIRTTSGERLTATLLQADEVALTVSPKTRIPEPIRRVPFEDVARLELHQNGSPIVKAVAIGAGVGAGTFLGLLMLMLAGLD